MTDEVLDAKETWRTVQAMIKLYPQLESELHFSNPYECVAAVLLSAQTTDVAVNLVTPTLFERYPTPYELAQADQDDVIDIIRSIGLYKNKSKALIGMAQKIVEDYDGQVPQTRKELESLPGVGRKTASVVLSAGFGIPAFAVDTHIQRVTKKFHLVSPDASTLQIEKEMTQKIPEEYWHQAHHSILLFGRYQCVARKHDHEECVRLVQENLPKDA